MKPTHRTTLLLAGITLAFTPTNLHAQTAWDNGAATTDYATALNWAGDVIPGDGNANGALIGSSATHTVVYSTATSYTSTGTGKANSLLVGTGTAGNGSLTLSGSAGTLTFGGDGYGNAAWIGSGSDTAATGTVTVTAGKLAIGTGAGSDASINLGVQIGGSGIKNGTLLINGGTVEVGRRILMGANATTAVSLLTISSGTLDMKRTGSNGEGDLGMIRFGTGTNTVNLDGGTAILTGFHISGATNARSNIYFNGTTLKAKAANADFFLGTTANANLQIKNNGLIFDTNTFAVTINDALSNFSGHTGLLTKQGAGTLTLSSGTSSYTGNISITGGTLLATGTTGGLNPTTSALGNPQTASRTITVGSGAILSFGNNDILGNASSTVVAKLIANGGTITNNGAFFTTLGSVDLNAGTINSTGGAAPAFPSFFLNGTVTVGGSAVSTISGSGANSQMTLASPTTFNVADATSSAASDLDVSVVLQGGGLTKTGVGTMTLSGANTYTGATMISAGTLTLSGAGAVNSSSGHTVSGSGAKFLQTSSTAVSPTVTLTQGTLTGSGTVNTVNVGAGTGGIISNNNGVGGAALTIGTLTLAGGATINLFSDGASTAADLTVTTLTNDSAANAVTITASNLTGWTNGSTYNLIGYTTLNGTGGNNFAQLVNNLTPRQSATWGDTGSAITLAIAGDTPYWVGDGDGNWNLGSTNNWKLVTAGTYTTFLANDVLLFNDNATGAGPITVNINAGDVATFSTTFDNSTKNYVLSGASGISSGSLIKTGTGSVTINNANTYSGVTTITAGTVNLAGSLDSTAISVGANGTLTETSAGVIGGSASLTTSGSVTLSGVNTYTGATNINAGTVAISGSGTLGTGSALTLGGGQLDLGGTTGVTVGAVSVTTPAGSGDTITNGSLTGTSYAVSNTTGIATISANLLVNGATGFTKTGAGTVTLSGANTYTGATTLSLGTLIANNATTPLGSAASQLNLNGGTLDLQDIGTAYNTTVGGTTTIQANNASSGPGTTKTLGTLSIGAFQLNVAPGANATGSTAAITFGATTLTGAPTFDVAANSTLNLGAVGGSVGLTKQNSGTLILTGANTYSGATVISGGTLQISGSGNLTAGTYTPAITIGNNATLQYSSSANQTLGGLISGAGGLTKDTSGSSTLTLSNGGSSFTGNINITGGTLRATGATGGGNPTTGSLGNPQTASRTITVGTGAALSFGNNDILGNHASSPVVKLVVNGGTITNNGNFFATLGAVDLNAGTINSTGGANANFPSFSLRGPITVGGSAASTISGSGANSQMVVGGNTAGSQTTFDVANATGDSAADLTVSVLLQNNRNAAFATVATGIIKTGVGTMTLSGANTYTGGTTVSAGTLNLNTTTANSISGNLTVSGGSAVLQQSNQLANTSNVVVGGGALDIAGNSDTVNGVQLTSGSITGSGGTLTSSTAFDLQGGSASAILGGTLGASKTTGGTVTLTGANTYTGNTTVSDGTLVLADDAQLRFVLGATTGVNNSLTGAGTVTLNGDFVIDTSAADALASGSWTLENVPTLSGAYGSTFSVVGFTATGDKWTKDNGLTKRYTFDEETGILTLGPIPVGGYSTWAVTNAPSTTSGQDQDGDGVINSVEYVLGGTITTNDLDKLPEISTTPGGDMLFSFDRDQDSIDGTTTVTIEVGTTLITWPDSYSVPGPAQAIVPGVTVAKDTSAGFDTVTLNIVRAPDTAKFARLKVVVTP